MAKRIGNKTWQTYCPDCGGTTNFRTSSIGGTTRCRNCGCKIDLGVPGDTDSLALIGHFIWLMVILGLLFGLAALQNLLLILAVFLIVGILFWIQKSLLETSKESAKDVVNRRHNEASKESANGVVSRSAPSMQTEYEERERVTQIARERRKLIKFYRDKVEKDERARMVAAYKQRHQNTSEVPLKYLTWKPKPNDINEKVMALVIKHQKVQQVKKKELKQQGDGDFYLICACLIAGLILPIIWLFFYFV